MPPFLQMAARLIAKERAGAYPGGMEHRAERFAWLGGMSFFWTKRALCAGLYRDALKLAAIGRSMILTAIVWRLKAWIKGRRPVEVCSCRTAEPCARQEDSLIVTATAEHSHRVLRG